MTTTEEGILKKIKGTTFTSLPSGKSVVCEITLENGFTVRGESSVVDKSTFDPKIGEQIAFEDAFRKIWALEGYLLQEKMFKGEINE